MHATATVAAPPAVRSGFASLKFTIQASRPGLWSTAAWFYLLPLGQRHLLHSAAFWIGLFYVTFPLGLFIYGCNDLVDREADQINPRKGTFLFGARGSAAELAALPRRIVLVHLPFLLLFCWFAGAKMLGWFAALAFFTALYNLPRYGLKSHPPFEILNQAGYLLVFLLSSWLNQVPHLPLATLIFGALFAMHSHVFGEIMDIEPDLRSGRRTTATVIGRVRSKLLISGFLITESILVARYFHEGIITGFLAASAVWFLIDAFAVWRSRSYSAGQMRFFMLAWNAIALGSMVWVWSRASFLQVH